MFGYKRKRLWKGALLLFALLISVASLLYTNYLVDKLMEEEERKVKLWADAYRQLNTNQGSGDLTFLVNFIRQNKTVPVILVNEKGKILSYRNFDTTRTDLREALKEIKATRDPIRLKVSEGNFNYIYYKDSILVRQLRYFPYIQLLVIALFFGVAYFAFSASRKYEQNRVWVGLAKETAHQLGTPLSSLMGWIQYLKTSKGQLNEQILNELEKDVDRLQVVTNRFSKIGSMPNLEVRNLYDEICNTVEYLRSRFSNKVNIEIDENSNRQVQVPLNVSLFTWVIENLIKNAIDATDHEGTISFYIEERDKGVCVDVTDTGKGINRSDFKTVFNPGYSTRKRGWGLGLSLTKRIIEHYHKGQIFVKSSEPNQGTTFRIKLSKEIR